MSFAQVGSLQYQPLFSRTTPFTVCSHSLIFVKSGLFTQSFLTHKLLLSIAKVHVSGTVRSGRLGSYYSIWCGRWKRTIYLLYTEIRPHIQSLLPALSIMILLPFNDVPIIYTIHDIQSWSTAQSTSSSRVWPYKMTIYSLLSSLFPSHHCKINQSKHTLLCVLLYREWCPLGLVKELLRIGTASYTITYILVTHTLAIYMK